MLGMGVLTADKVEAKLKEMRAVAPSQSVDDTPGGRATLLMAKVTPEDIAQVTGSVEVNIPRAAVLSEVSPESKTLVLPEEPSEPEPSALAPDLIPVPEPESVPKTPKARPLDSASKRSTMLLAQASPEVLDFGEGSHDGWPSPEEFSVEESISQSTDSKNVDLGKADEETTQEDVAAAEAIPKVRTEQAFADTLKAEDEEEQEPEPSAVVYSEEAFADTLEGNRADMLDEISGELQDSRIREEADAQPPKTVPSQPAVADASIQGKSTETPEEQPSGSNRGQATALINRDIQDVVATSHSFDEATPEESSQITALKWAIIAVTLLLILATVGLVVAWQFVKGKEAQEGRLENVPAAVTFIIDDVGSSS
jgi:flagellar basal body-associated protein FliL